MFTPTIRSAYPLGGDLYTFLVAAGMLKLPMAQAATLLDLSGACQSAVSEWERLTDWHPFLAPPSSSADTSRTIYPDSSFYQSSPSFGFTDGYAFGIGAPGYGGLNYNLPLNAGLLSCSSVTAVGVSYVIGGATPQVLLAPQDALVRGLPYDALRFLASVGYGPAGIAVTGRWGYCDTLPGDAWNALLGYAAREIAPSLAFALTGNIQSYTEGDVSEKFLDGPFDKASAHWSAQFQRAAMRYKRRSIV